MTLSGHSDTAISAHFGRFVRLICDGPKPMQLDAK
jgi:hypothetical protein